MGPVFGHACGLIGQKNIPESVAAGVYFDDPCVSGRDNCRAFCGMLIPPNALTSALASWFASQNLSVRQLPVSKALVTSFPIRNNYSYRIAGPKIYKAVTNNMNIKMGVNKQCSLETYAKTVATYYFPIDNLDAWWHQPKKSR